MKNKHAVALGSLGGKIGGKSKSKKKLAAINRNLKLAQKAKKKYRISDDERDKAIERYETAKANGTLDRDFPIVGNVYSLKSKQVKTK